MSDVEIYIAKFNSEKQDRLVKIRSIIKERFPLSTERVYFGVPTVEVDGEIVLHYAGYKNHVSIIVGYVLAALLQEKYPQYQYTRATVVFPDKQSFPEDFIKEICGMIG